MAQMFGANQWFRIFSEGGLREYFTVLSGTIREYV
jgi:hypothetical protein